MYYLLWHCHAEQQNLICARTIKSAVETFKVALDKHKDAKPVAMYEAEQTPLPEDFKAAQARGRQLQKMRDFVSNITCRIQMAENDLHTTLNVFRPCANLKSGEDDSDPQFCEDCDLCFDCGLVPNSKTWEEFYEQSKSIDADL